MNSQALWYLARGSGVVLLVLLTLVLVLGLVTRAGRPLPGLPRFTVTGLHRNAGLLAVAFLALHIGTSVLDSYVSLGWTAAFIPFVSGYRPLQVGLGTVAFDLLLAIVATSLFRQRLGVRTWRAVHWSAYAVWPIAVLHGLLTGTDLQHGWFLALTVGCAAVVVTAIGWRVATAPRAARAVAVPARQAVRS